MNTDCYPDAEELKRIRAWPLDEAGNFDPLMAYIRERWMYAEHGYWTQRGPIYRLATGGWSGNEDLIRAMRGNTLFWRFCHLASISSGLYLFCTDPASATRSDLLRTLQTVTRLSHSSPWPE